MHIVQSASCVRPSVRLSACDVGGSEAHRLEIGSVSETREDTGKVTMEENKLAVVVVVYKKFEIVHREVKKTSL